MSNLTHVEDKKIHLTKTMAEIVKLLRGGYSIYAGLNNYAQISENHLSYCRKEIKKASVSALEKRGIIEQKGLVGPYMRYSLTSIGKIIEL